MLICVSGNRNMHQVSQLKWIDTHCHFDFAAFDSDRASVWERAQSFGVQALIIPGVDRTKGERLSEFCHNQPWFYSLGLHPCFVDRHQDKDLDWLEQSLGKRGNDCTLDGDNKDYKHTDFSIPIAIGEIGLDFRPQFDENSRRRQLELFEAQLSIAKRHGLAVILHAVKAHDQVAASIRRSGITSGGIVHGFSGSVQQAHAYLDLGFKLGLGGAFTHNRAQRLRRTLTSLPSSAWLLETDAPDMPPAFAASARNSPEQIPVIAQAYSRLASLELESFSHQQQLSLAEVFPAVVRHLTEFIPVSK